MKHRKLTKKVIGAFYEVYNELGPGFLESVYENALYLVLKENGLDVEKQYPTSVYFRGTIVGNFRADLLVEEKVLIELKAVRTILPNHEAQTINYLKATEIDIGLLMNFGDKPEFKRFIFEEKEIIRVKSARIRGLHTRKYNFTSIFILAHIVMRLLGISPVIYLIDHRFELS